MKFIHVKKIKKQVELSQQLHNTKLNDDPLTRTQGDNVVAKTIQQMAKAFISSNPSISKGFVISRIYHHP